jgi:thioredoxin reductase (NADPH)
MADRVLRHPKIEVMWDTVLTDILDQEKGVVEAVRLKNVKTGEEALLETDGVFVAIGHKPNTEIFEGLLERSDNGYVLLQGSSRTNVEGIFAAGDVHDQVYRQSVTAAGAGCRAAIDCERYLQEEE